MRDLPDILTPGDCLVVNNSRVAAARLVGERTATGGRWEGLYLADETGGAMRLLCKCRGKLAPGESVTLFDSQGRPDLQLAMLQKLPEGMWVAKPLADVTPQELLQRLGRVPLPPYIRGGEMTEADRERYQTVFARELGSVAAPTAGLHFTEGLVQGLLTHGVELAEISLHVGLGTFRPIQGDSLDDHTMHAERGRLDAENAAKISRRREAGSRAVAVGTTSVRVLESAAAGGALQPWEGETDLFIRPGYRFRAIDALMTNFHLPRTTLLVLVCTFAGRDLILRRLRRSDPRTLPLLQLWRRDAHPLTRAHPLTKPRPVSQVKPWTPRPRCLYWAFWPRRAAASLACNSCFQ